jgi:phosphoribosylaminoimidazole (AIR) synthetase
MDKAKIEECGMLRTFHTFMGMVMITSQNDLPATKVIGKKKEQALYAIGGIRAGEPRVVYDIWAD